jgi:glycosyltransferase involved in cell wall biosynthesis
MLGEVMIAHELPVFPMAFPPRAHRSLHSNQSREWRLGMVALVRPRKGIEVLLEALAKTLPSHPNVSLDVIGPFETPEYEQIRQ